MVSPKKKGTRFYICNNLFLSSTPLSRFESLSFYFVKIMDGSTIVIFHISTSDNMICMYVYVCLRRMNIFVLDFVCLTERFMR